MRVVYYIQQRRFLMFGERLKELRRNNKLTQQELANTLKVSASTIGMYEQGRRSPDTGTLNQVAEHFDVSVDWLLGRTDFSHSTLNPYNKLLTQKDEKDIAKDLEKTLGQLEGAQDGLMFDGEALDDETRELLKISLENSMRLAKQIAKKYTPNKYKK